MIIFMHYIAGSHSAKATAEFLASIGFKNDSYVDAIA